MTQLRSVFYVPTQVVRGLVCVRVCVCTRACVGVNVCVCGPHERGVYLILSRSVSSETNHPLTNICGASLAPASCSVVIADARPTALLESAASVVSADDCSHCSMRTHIVSSMRFRL
jgi:hypothetical protein